MRVFKCFTYSVCLVCSGFIITGRTQALSYQQSVIICVAGQQLTNNRNSVNFGGWDSDRKTYLVSSPMYYRVYKFQEYLQHAMKKIYLYQLKLCSLSIISYIMLLIYY